MQIKKLFAVMMIALLTFMTMATGQVAHAEAGDDVRTTGSLTIHKYEVEPRLQSEGEDGDGSANGKAFRRMRKLLEGVKYTITQNSLHITPLLTSGQKLLEQYQCIKVTGTDGIATFDGLGLGRYTVNETAGPPHVNLNPDSYSVDIPMTSADGTR